MKFFRKSAVFFLLFVALFAGAAIWFGQSSLLARSIETAMSALLDTEVEVKQARMDLLKGQGNFSGLNVVDKDNSAQYLFVAGAGSFDIDFLYLLAGKVVINDMSLTDVELLVPRKIPRSAINTPTPTVAEPAASAESAPSAGAQATAVATKKPKKDKLAELKKDLPNIDLTAMEQEFSIDKLTKPDQLPSVLTMKKSYEQAGESIKKIDGDFDSAKLDSRYDELMKNIDAVQSNKFKNAKEIKDGIKQLQSIKKDADSLLADTKKLQKSINTDLKAIKPEQNISKLIDQDVEDLKKLAKLADVDVSQIAKLLFGASIIEQYADFQHYWSMVDEFMDDGDDITEQPRARGVDYHFPLPGQPPAFLVKKISISGSKSTQSITGQINNLNSNPVQYKPIGVDLAKTTMVNNWTLKGVLFKDRKVGNHQLDFQMKGRIFEKFANNNASAGMPTQIGLGNEDTDVTIRNVQGSKQFDMVYAANKLDFSFGVLSKPMHRNIASVFQNINTLDMKSRMLETDKGIDFSLSSSLDKQVSSGLQKILGKKVKAAEKQIEKYVKSSVSSQLAKQRKTLDNQKGAVATKLKKSLGNSKKVDKQLASAEKALNGKLEKLLKSSATDKAKKDLGKKLKSLKF